MTFLTDRLTELRRHLDHLYALRDSVSRPEDLRRDLTLHNDVLYSLLTVAQLVIDISGELSARRGLRFDDYTSAVRNLAGYDEFSDELVERLARLPGFRNVLIHEYATLDFDIVIEALRDLGPVERFLETVVQMEGADG